MIDLIKLKIEAAEKIYKDITERLVTNDINAAFFLEQSKLMPHGTERVKLMQKSNEAKEFVAENKLLLNIIRQKIEQYIIEADKKNTSQN